MEVTAELRYARMSAQKCRLVADLIRGQSVQKALDMLTFSSKKAAVLVKGVLSSAIANAEHNNGLDIDLLKVSTVYVNQAPMMKRFHARAKGRGVRIQKHSCHITVKVSEESKGV